LRGLFVAAEEFGGEAEEGLVLGEMVSEEVVEEVGGITRSKWLSAFSTVDCSSAMVSVWQIGPTVQLFMQCWVDW